jgi:flotillin
MEAILGGIRSLFIPFLVIIALFSLFAVLIIVARNYIKVPPNRAAFFYGKGGKRRKRVPSGKLPVGVEAATFLPRAVTVVTGGAKLRIPLLQEVEYLDLTEITIENLKVTDVPNVDGVLVTVDAVANVKFKSDEESLLAAGERFLGKHRDEITRFAFQNLESHLRGIVGKLSVEDMVNNRQKFQQEVITEAGEDLAKVGMMVDIFNIQSITDKKGYIEAMGRRRTAEIVRDAEIGEAVAQRESTIKSTDAHREAEVRKQGNLALEAEAQKEKNVKVATYTAETNAENARAEQAGPFASAKARQEVIREEVKVEEERTRAQIAVEEQEILKEAKAQEASVVVPARAKRDAAVAEGEGVKKFTVLKAEGQRDAEMAIAEATKKKLQFEGEGGAIAIRAKGEAEGAAIRAQLLAKAEGLLRIAEAYKEFNQAAIQLETLKILPEVVQAMTPWFSSIAAPLGNIDRLIMIDSGGNGGEAGLSRLSQTVPKTIFSLLENAKAMGLDIEGLLSKVGIKSEDAQELIKLTSATDKGKGPKTQERFSTS